jgi:hypothetical protein
MAASTYNNNGYITRVTTEALSAGARVELNSTGCELADAVNEAIGTCEQNVEANTPATIRLFNTPGTRFGIASGAISARASVYAAASGKLSASATGGASAVGIALSATSADGDVLEYLPTSLLG